MITTTDIEIYLQQRLNRYNVDHGTVKEIAREIGGLCNAVELKHYRIEYISNLKQICRLNVFAEDEAIAFRQFYNSAESVDSVYLKTVLVE